MPSAYQRTVADLVVVFLDMLTVGEEQEALVQAAAVVSGPGADDLVEATRADITKRGAAERMTALSEKWASPLLASLATVYGAGGPGLLRRPICWRVPKQWLRAPAGGSHSRRTDQGRTINTGWAGERLILAAQHPAGGGPVTEASIGRGRSWSLGARSRRLSTRS